MGTECVAEPNGTRPSESGPVMRPKMSVAVMVTGLPGAVGSVAEKLPSAWIGRLGTDASLAVLVRLTLIGVLAVTGCGWPLLGAGVPARLMLMRRRALWRA